MSGLFGQADGAQFLSQAQTLQPGLELVFVDHDLATLLPELSRQHLRSTEIIQLDAQTDGFAQVTNILAQRKNITAIHLLSHGSAGQIQLGNTTLTQENLNQYQPQISHWRSALNAGADILIYGCDVASNSAGINLIHNLQKLTQADINASIDVTGNSALGGDWELELQLGTIETKAIVLTGSSGLLALGDGLKADYYDNADFTNLKLTRIDPTVNFNWGNASPDLTIAPNTFSTRWSGQVLAQYSEEYTFFTTGDDGIRLSVNGTQIINGWKDQPATEYSGKITLVAGQKYDIQLEYFQNGGGSVAQLAWSSISQTKQIIPQAQLFSSTITPPPGPTPPPPGPTPPPPGPTPPPPNTPNIYLGNRYILTSGLQSWTTAQAEAVRLGGNLVTINDTLEEAWLRQTFGGTEKLWIGLNDIRVEGTYEWVSGEVVGYRNWSPSEPNNAGNEDWIEMNFDATGRWNDEKVTAVRRGIIEIPGGGTPTLATIAIAQNSYSVNENAPTIDIPIVRTGDTTAASTVAYRADSNTATLGEDFSTTAGTITFAAGETRKVVSVQLLNDTILEGNEAFNFVIQSPADATLGTIRTATITILDDEGAVLTVNPIQVSESIGDAVVTLIRTNGNAPASLAYNTRNGTAIAGTDYQTMTGTVNFAVGETQKTIRIPIVNNTTSEFNEAFEVLFSDLVGLTLSDSTTTVTIADDDSAVTRESAVISGLVEPTGFAWTPGEQLMFIAQKNGIVRVAQGNVLSGTNFIDLRSVVNAARDRGLLGIAVHPDFYSGSPYIYLSYAYDPPEVNQNLFPATNLDGPDQVGNRTWRVVRVTADAANSYRTAVANSEVVILGKNSTWANINRPDGNSTNDFTIPESGRTADGEYITDFLKLDSESHMGGHLAFGADGALYVATGDGTSYNSADPRTISVQNLDSLSGKILRINPITGEGYADNPFQNGDLSSNRSRVWNLGLRNPFRFTIQPESNIPIIADVGWFSWEEVNVGIKGANFGWPGYEGGYVGSDRFNLRSFQQSNYISSVSAVRTFVNSNPAVTAPIFARSHTTDNAKAIVVGDFFRGELIVTDVNEGTLQALTLNAQNQVTAIRQFDAAVPWITYMESSLDGGLYYVNIASGTIGRWRSA
ncbi:MAG: hypothetical protein RLZZ511_3692 [Cyanobacteriota bacterium]